MMKRPDLVFYADLHAGAAKDHAKFMSEGGFAKLFEQNTTEVVKLKAQRAGSDTAGNLQRSSNGSGLAGGRKGGSVRQKKKRVLIRTMSNELVRSSDFRGAGAGGPRTSASLDDSELLEADECVAIYGTLRSQRTTVTFRANPTHHLTRPPLAQRTRFLFSILI